MPVGTVNAQGYTKMADGKWAKKPTKEMPKKESVGKNPKDKPEPKKEPTKEQTQTRDTIKSALKKMATILSDALSNRDAVATSAGAVEEVGENISRKSKEAKAKKQDKKDGKK